MYSRHVLAVDPNLVAPAVLEPPDDLAVPPRDDDDHLPRAARERHEEVLVVDVVVEDDRPVRHHVLLGRLAGGRLENGVEPPRSPGGLKALLDLPPILDLDAVEQGHAGAVGAEGGSDAPIAESALSGG